MLSSFCLILFKIITKNFLWSSLHFGNNSFLLTYWHWTVTWTRWQQDSVSRLNEWNSEVLQDEINSKNLMLKTNNVGQLLFLSCSNKHLKSDKNRIKDGRSEWGESVTNHLFVLVRKCQCYRRRIRIHTNFKDIFYFICLVILNNFMSCVVKMDSLSVS